MSTKKDVDESSSLLIHTKEVLSFEGVLGNTRKATA